MPSLLSTGDDDGVIKVRRTLNTAIFAANYICQLWDPRQRECTRNGDGSLSVMDVRSKKPEPLAHSEDQEDELLSIVAIKGASKVVVGTQIGILSIFNRSAGWGDCVDRVPGHPHSIDALCTLPPDILGVDTASTILTGSSDGFVRAVEILPTKLLGVVVDHGDWPVERIAIGGGTSQLTLDTADDNGGNVGKRADDDNEAEDVGRARGRWWVGSVGHEETLRLTDLEAFFHEANRSAGGLKESLDADGEQREVEDVEEDNNASDIESIAEPQEKSDSEEDSDDDEAPKAKKRKRKLEKNPLAVKKKGKNTVDVSEPRFFDDL
ncbi:hypothetical protein DXG01_008911 [Tephrocybe rancida]|nr:hypothetical protein DXG01_008911 [Tephrocybe rancida]